MAAVVKISSQIHAFTHLPNSCMNWVCFWIVHFEKEAAPHDF